jgi:hypothetical protein
LKIQKLEYSNLNLHLIEAANLFAAKLEESEHIYSWVDTDTTDDQRREFSQRHREHCAFAMGAILCSQAYVESIVNSGLELFRKSPGLELPFAADMVLKVQTELDKEDGPFRKTNALQKYNSLLKNLGKMPLQKANELYKDLDCLSGLRNAIAHSQPVWEERISGKNTLSKGLRRTSSVCQRLRSLKIGRNRFSEGEFPAEYLSKECADWVCGVAQKFRSDFESRTGCQVNEKRSFISLNVELDEND